MPRTLAISELVLDSTRAYTTADLMAVSSKAGINRAVGSGVLTRILPGVYANSRHARSFTTRADAALLWAGTDSIIGGASAMWIWGMLARPPIPVELFTPEQRRLRAPDWIDLTRVVTLAPSSAVGRLRVASPADAVVRGFSRVAPRERASVVYRATQRRLVGTPQLRDALARTERVPERRKLESIIDAIERGAESFLEERALRTVFNTREFSHLIPQHDYFLEGWTYRIDLYDARTRTAFEMDSAAHHSTWSDRVRDLRRDAHLATDGVLTVRYPYEDIVKSPAECRRVAIEIMRSRACGTQ